MRPHGDKNVNPHIPRHWQKLVAVFVASVLATAGLLPFATAAHATTASLSVSSSPLGGGSITVTGSGFDQTNMDGYLLAIAPSQYSNYSAALTANAFVAGTQFLLQPNATQDLQSTPKIDTLSGAGTFSITVAVPAATAEGWTVFITHAATPNSDTTLKKPIAYSAVPTPTITVSTSSNGQPTNLEPTATTQLTVTGTGFVANPTGIATNTTQGNRPPLSGSFGGIYVVFGKFLNQWQPSAGAPSSSRTVITQKWGVATAANLTAIGGVNAGGFVLNQDGTFSVNIDVAPSVAHDLISGNYGIYTYPGSGAKYAAFETYTPITFLPRPTITVSQSTTNIASGTQVTVTGTGFTPRAATTGTRPPLAGTFSGVYVTFGRFADTWKPSAGAASSTRKTDATSLKWAVPPSSLSAIGSGGIELDANGNFQVTMTLADNFVGMPSTGNFGIYTYSGSGANSSAFETYTPVSFAASAPTQLVEVTPEASQPNATGYLTWGIDNNFRSYVLGNIAQGNVSALSGATANGANFNFGQSSTSYNFNNLVGSTNYSGSIRFIGHAGSLDLTFSNPTIVVNSPQSATLNLTVNGLQVEFGTIDLGTAGRASVNGAQLYTNAAVTLTAAGAAAFNGFYPAGRLLSPITFQVGLDGAAPRGSVGTISVVSVKKFTPPSSPPANTGITLAPTALRALTSGAQATITVDGFQPNETGIAIVVYSTPTVLAENLTADANGVVTWSGKLPEGLDGNHTLTVQGSIAKGIELTVSAEPEACVAENSALTWGFKDSFLAYLDSNIANGSWKLTDVTETDNGEFVWSNGAGDISALLDAGTFDYEGSVLFTGHDGALNTTIANPRLVFTSATTAELYLDITGVTQGGTDTAAQAVKFATVEWAEAGESGSTLELINGNVTLTQAGAGAFGTYPAGEVMAPLSVTGEVSCADNSAMVTDADTAATESNNGGAIWVGILALAIFIAVIALVWFIIRRTRA